jgi:hypothetical protein
MHHHLRPLLTACLLLATFQLNAAVSTQNWSMAVLKETLAQVQPGQKLVQLGDMQVPVAYLQNWYDKLTGGLQPQSTFDQYFTAWPNGNIYYSFDASVSFPHQKAFLDAASEWATFANLHFILRTNQANFIIITNSPALDGGLSAVGMAGGPQLLQIGSTAWNRSTLCHEIGHTLGLVHEHQRSDRDNYISIITSNITSNGLAAFVILPSSLNKTPYDFFSVMHYGQHYYSVSPNADTIVAQPAYAQYQNIMGSQFDPVLSQGDRTGMALVYGAGPGATNIVTTTADSGPGSMRSALYYAFDHPGTTISFNIPATDAGYSNGIFNILPSDGFPSLVNETILDGSTEPVLSQSHAPAIFLNGILCHDASVYPNGLQFKGTNCTARSFIINNFPDFGVSITGSNAMGNTLSSCYVGADTSGNLAVSNGICSVQINGGAHDNTIGGLTPAMRNIIGGSIYQGLVIHDPGSDRNIVEGNFIGINASGTAPLPNSWSGIQIYGGAQSNLIGGFTTAARNVISGNLFQGVVISDKNSDGNIIAGNYIGVDPTGSFPIQNGWSGVEIFGGAQSNIIGGITTNARNVISGNTYQGVLISDTNSDGNVIAENYIGVNASGSFAVTNGWSGVECFGGASDNQIGPSNIISANLNYGVVISQPGTMGNIVVNNIIGLDVTGQVPLGNHYAGVGIYGGSQSNWIGANLISANTYQGVAIGETGTQGNIVQGNYLGVNATGTAAIGNGGAGVNLYGGANANLIGGSTPGMLNLISGNHNQGILLQDTGTVHNAVLGNRIGLNSTGNAAISNAWDGIEIYNGPSANQIGGRGAGRNFISGNGIYGIGIDFGSSGNFVQGNTFGLDTANAVSIPNNYAAVAIYAGSTSNYIGGTAPGTANLIAESMAEGVLISDAATTNNTVRGNSIFGSTRSPIALYNGANNGIPYPALFTAVIATNLTITGSFTGSAGVNYVIDFYADAPPAGNAQSRTYLGSKSITGTGSPVAFTAALSSRLPNGRAITATATDSAGDTSGLSAGIAATMTSSVNDGIPNAWRALYFGGSGMTTNSLSAATADPDHDGLNNLQEFLAGTNPTNSASLLHLTAFGPNLSTNTIGLQSANGIIYRILYRDSFSGTTWAIFADQVVGDGTELLLSDPAASSLNQRFYRAQIMW